MINFLKELSGLERTILGAIVAVFVLLFLSARENLEKKQAFFASCEIEKKHYECEVLWGQSNAGSGSDVMNAALIGGALAGSAGR